MSCAPPVLRVFYEYMKSFSQNITGIIIFFLLITLVFSVLPRLIGETPDTLSLSDVARKIQAGEVTTLVVSGNEVSLTLKDGAEALSQKEPDSSITETLKNYGVTSEALQAVEVKVEREGGARYWLGILIPTILPLIVIGVFFWWMFRRARGGMERAFTFGKANLRLWNPRDKARTTFGDVAGVEGSKEELEEVVEFLKNPKKFLEIGARIPRGVLLVGAPGTGKTLLARAVAGESGVPFFHISASEFVEMFVGVGASRVRDVFQTAKRAAPAIIFIDEIDAVGRQRGAGLGGGHDEREQTLNQILVEMDGFERDTKVIVVAATNRPDILDPALLRPGRFDRRIILEMPDMTSRKDILKIHTRDKKMAPGVSLDRVAVRTPGFSGADLANLMNEAAILAARRNKKQVEEVDMLDSIEKVMLGPERRSRVIPEKEKEIAAYHEAGHALVAAGLTDADPVHKISIVNRGFAGGYTIKLPTEERRLKTRSQFMADIAVALGGYAAEQAKFKDVTTGSSNDIKQLTELAHRLVTQYGMSEKLGPRQFGDTEEMVFLGKEIAMEKNYSEEIASVIDREVDAAIQKGLKTAAKIIKENREILDVLAKTLIAQETIEQEGFEKLVKQYKVKKVKV